MIVTLLYTIFFSSKKISFVFDLLHNLISDVGGGGGLNVSPFFKSKIHIQN